MLLIVFGVVVLPFSFNFAILASGFKSSSLPHLKYYSERIVLPSMHIFGTTDKIICTGMLFYDLKLFTYKIHLFSEMSEALRNSFENSLAIKHEGGHYLPASALQKEDYQKFIKTQLFLKNHRKNIL